MYIYIHTHTQIYIYIYIHGIVNELYGHIASLANFPTLDTSSDWILAARLIDLSDHLGQDADGLSKLIWEEHGNKKF